MEERIIVLTIPQRTSSSKQNQENIARKLLMVSGAFIIGLLVVYVLIVSLIMRSENHQQGETSVKETVSTEQESGSTHSVGSTSSLGSTSSTNSTNSIGSDQPAASIEPVVLTEPTEQLEQPEQPELIEGCEQFEQLEQLEQLTEDNSTYLGMYRITAYCSCEKCCGKRDRPIGEDGRVIVFGAQGTELVNHVSVACNLPFGTKLKIEGLEGEFIVQDRTSKWIQERYNGYVIDIYCDSHQGCYEYLSGLSEYMKVYQIEE